MPTIQKRGTSWRAMVRRKGHSFDATFDTEQDARAWAERKEAAILSGNMQPMASQKALTTFPDLMERYAKEVSVEKRGYLWERNRLHALAKSPEFQIPVTSIDGPLMAQWRDIRLKEVSSATVNRELNLLSAVLTRSIREWRVGLPVNPVHQIQRPKQPAHRTRRVSDEERDEILKALGWDGKRVPADVREWTAWCFGFALETMMRQGEIMSMVWRHVHADRSYVHLPKTKNGYTRDVPLSSRALALLAILTPGIGNQRVVPASATTVGGYFREAVRSLGIENMHFHDSRREALTRLAPLLGDPLALGFASGHRDLRSLRIYYAPDATDVAKKLG